MSAVAWGPFAASALVFVTSVAVFLVVPRSRRARAELASGGAGRSSAACEAGSRVSARPQRPTHVPRHVAFIMDGNRRYGQRRFGAERRLEGHAEGGKKLGEVVEWCIDAGVEQMTCFAFSTENWNRGPGEVQLLMRTFLSQFDKIRETAREKRVRVTVLCTDASRFPTDVSAALEALVADTKEFEDFVLNLAISYGARGELVNAARALAAKVQAGALTAAAIDEAAFERELQLSDAPDLLVRTSGECRISNFLLWQLAYSELAFVDKLWPDLSRADLDSVFADYAQRQRRFGK